MRLTMTPDYQKIAKALGMSANPDIASALASKDRAGADIDGLMRLERQAEAAKLEREMESLDLSRKQTALSEKSIALSRIAIWLAVVSLIVALWALLK